MGSWRGVYPPAVAAKDQRFPGFRVRRGERTFGCVAEFLVELYVSRTDAASVERGAARARLAAEQLTREGTPVRYLRSIFVPEDETCFFLCEAGSVEAVRDTARLAGLRFERIAEAVAPTSGGEVQECP